MEHFGDYLYRLRMRRGKYISQQKLARLSGYTQTYISLVETGRHISSKRFKKAVLMALGMKVFSGIKQYNVI